MSKTGKLDVTYFPKDNSIQEFSLRVFMGLATDMKEERSGEMVRAWNIDTSNQIFNPRTQSYEQVISEMDATPIQMFGPEPRKASKESINAIAAQVTDDEINYVLSGKKITRHLKWVGIVAVVLAVVIMIMIFFKIKQAGLI